MELGKNIAMHRKRKRMTQAQLAKIAGVSAGYVAAIEEGWRTPRLKTLVIIATILGVGIEELCKEEADA